MNIFKRENNGAKSWPVIISRIFVTSLLIYLFYAACHEDKTHPEVNKIVKVKGVYELSDTLLLCTQAYMPHRQHFCLISRDSTTTLRSDDICIHCGKKLSEHHTEDVWLGKQITDSY